MRHLVKMASYSSETNMHARNLAIVWAPNLLRFVYSTYYYTYVLFHFCFKAENPETENLSSVTWSSVNKFCTTLKS